MCTNQDISNIPFIMRENHFLVHEHKKDFPHITCNFHLLKYVVKMLLVSAILHHIFLLRLLPKSYFKISTFQPNFLCSSSFKKIKQIPFNPENFFYLHCKCSTLLENYLFIVKKLNISLNTHIST